MIVWHYTVGTKMPSILLDGVIRLAEGGIEPREKAAAWFSARVDFEPTAIKDAILKQGHRVKLTLAQCERATGGLYRIGTDSFDLLHFTQFRRMSGISSRGASGLVKRGQARGAFAGDWWVSFSPVPRERWIAIECRDEHGAWVPASATL